MDFDAETSTNTINLDGYTFVLLDLNSLLLPSSPVTPLLDASSRRHEFSRTGPAVTRDVVILVVDVVSAASVVAITRVVPRCAVMAATRVDQSHLMTHCLLDLPDFEGVRCRSWRLG